MAIDPSILCEGMVLLRNNNEHTGTIHNMKFIITKNKQYTLTLSNIDHSYYLGRTHDKNIRKIKINCLLMINNFL